MINILSFPHNPIPMIKNYFTIALRNILKQKGYSLINLLGLSIGMAATILILLFVEYELSFDKYHEKSDNIYRISREWVNEDGETNLHLGHVAPPFAPLIENDFEGIVEEAVRFMSGYSPLIKMEDKNIVEDGFFFADQDVFKVFSWNFITGDPNTALAEPNSIILTKRAAEKYFEDRDPVGEQLTFSNFGMEIAMEITGVIEDVPSNSHFEFDILCSMATLEDVMGRDNMMGL